MAGDPYFLTTASDALLSSFAVACWLREFPTQALTYALQASGRLEHPDMAQQTSPTGNIAPPDLSDNLESSDATAAVGDSGQAVKRDNEEKGDPNPEDDPPADDRDGHVKETADVSKGASTTSPATATESLLLEIRALQERLSQLEGVAAKEQPWDQEEKRLRKEIRRARWAKKATKKAEERAENTRSQRENHAYEFELLSRLYDEVNHEVADGDALPYQVVKVEDHVPNDFATVREE